MPEPGRGEGFRIVRPPEKTQALTHTPLRNLPHRLLQSARERLQGGGNWQDRALRKLGKEDQVQIKALRKLIADNAKSRRREVWVYGGSGFDPTPTLLSAPGARHVWLDPVYDRNNRFHHNEIYIKGGALEEFYRQCGGRVQLDKSWGVVGTSGRQKLTVDGALQIDMYGEDFRDAASTPDEIDVLYQRHEGLGLISALSLNNLRKGGLVVFLNGGMWEGFPIPKQLDGLVQHGFEAVADFPVSHMRLRASKWASPENQKAKGHFLADNGKDEYQVYRKVADTSFTQPQLTQILTSHR